jgi:hypothetical protein
MKFQGLKHGAQHEIFEEIRKNQQRYVRKTRSMWYPRSVAKKIFLKEQLRPIVEGDQELQKRLDQEELT